MFLVLLYPIILFFPSLFGVMAFFLTAPYFFGIFIVLFFLVIIQGKIVVFELLYLLIPLIGLGLYNFTSIRYSLPLFFLFYILLLLIVLHNLKYKSINQNMLNWFLNVYLVLSIPFIFMDIGWDITGRFTGFIGSPTVFSGVIAALYVIVTEKWNIKSRRFIVMSLIVFGIVYLTKTRLILIFILFYPLIKYLYTTKKWMTTKKLFLIFLIAIMSIYPLYDMVIRWFPVLVSMRYEDKRDASFGLRHFVFKKMNSEYSEGTLIEKTIGKGNEYSRVYIHDLFGFDLMPHNDFVRLLTDWGAIGLFLFLLFLYKVSVKDRDVFYISIVYLLLFYSNMVFNTFIISLLIIFYNSNQNTEIHYEK